MKNFSIRYAALFAALTILLTGCLNVFDPQDKEAGLHITIANDNARTLFPNTNFTKYALSFQNASASRPDITLTGGESSVTITDLADGDWDITAVGYVTIDGTEYAAAEGTAQVTVSSQSFQGVTIPITASMSGPDGFFSYSVSFPEGKVQSAWLSIFPFNQWPQNQIDLLETPADTVALAPGYYMMTIRLQTGYETAARTEVVHIYSNMETVADYHFTEDDFTRTITLSGTVDVTVDGQLPSWAQVSAYLDADYEISASSSSWANINLENGTWAMMILPFDTDTTLHFQVYVYDSTSFYKGTGVSVTVKDQNISGIALGSVNLTTLTLSGTAAVTVNGYSSWDKRVRIYTDANFHDYIGQAQLSSSGTTWSTTILTFDTDTVLYFTVWSRDSNDYWGEKDTGITRTVKDGDVSGIDLGAIDIQYITLSGTITLTVNGQIPSNANLYAYENYPLSQIRAGHSTIDLANNTWTMAILPWPTDRVLYFEVQFYTEDSNNNLRKELSASVTVRDQDMHNVDLGAVDFPAVILSGTVAVTIDGEPLASSSGVTITAHSNSGIVFTTSAYQYNGYVWSVTIDPFAVDTLLRFSVSFQTNNWVNVQRETDVSITVKDQSMDNIAIVYDLPLLTLGGTVAVTANGATPQGDVYVVAYRDTTFSNSIFSAQVDLQNNTWSHKQLPFVADTSMYFVVHFDQFSKDTGITITAKDQNRTDINLGAVNFNVITLSGTADITVNGETPYGFVLQVFRDADYSYSSYVAGVSKYQYEGNTWSMLLEPFETDTPLYFEVQSYNDYTKRELGVLVTAKDQDISGITIVYDFTD